MKKIFEKESIDALTTAGFWLGTVIYFALFGVWGFIAVFYLIIFFFALPLLWKKFPLKGDKVSIVLLGLWWLLPILTLLF